MSQTAKQYRLPGEDDKVVIAALLRATYRYRGIVPMILGGMLVAMGTGLLILFLQPAHWLLWGLAILILASGILYFRTGWKAIQQEGGYYRHLLADGQKTVVSGILKDARVINDHSIEYQVNDTTLPVCLLLGRKFPKYNGYTILDHDCLLQKEIILHYITPPGGRNILLQAEYPGMPGQATLQPVSEADWSHLKSARRTVNRIMLLLMAAFFAIISAVTAGDLVLWLAATGVLLLVGLVIFSGNRAAEKKQNRITQKVEVAGTINQVTVFRYSITPRATSFCVMLFIGGKPYTLFGDNHNKEWSCGQQVMFSYFDDHTSLVPVRLTGEIKRW